MRPRTASLKASEPHAGQKLRNSFDGAAFTAPLAPSMASAHAGTLEGNESVLRRHVRTPEMAPVLEGGAEAAEGGAEAAEGSADGQKGAGERSGSMESGVETGGLQPAWSELVALVNGVRSGMSDVRPGDIKTMLVKALAAAITGPSHDDSPLPSDTLAVRRMGPKCREGLMCTRLASRERAREQAGQG